MPSPAHAPNPPPLQYSIAEYRDRLYLEIVRRKKEIRRRAKEREAQRAAASGKRGSVTAQQQSQQYYHGGGTYNVHASTEGSWR